MPATTSTVSPVVAAPAGSPDNIQILLARIRVAKANGQPTDELRKQLLEAVAGFK
jgi:hypothetical protein